METRLVKDCVGILASTFSSHPMLGNLKGQIDESDISLRQALHRIRMNRSALFVCKYSYLYDEIYFVHSYIEQDCRSCTKQDCPGCRALTFKCFAISSCTFVAKMVTHASDRRKRKTIEKF